MRLSRSLFFLASIASCLVAFLAPEIAPIALALPIVLVACWALSEIWQAVAPFRPDLFAGHIRATRRENSHPDWLKRFASIDRSWRLPGSSLPDPGIRV